MITDLIIIISINCYCSHVITAPFFVCLDLIIIQNQKVKVLILIIKYFIRIRYVYFTLKIHSIKYSKESVKTPIFEVQN